MLETQALRVMKQSNYMTHLVPTPPLRSLVPSREKIELKRRWRTDEKYLCLITHLRTNKSTCLSIVVVVQWGQADVWDLNFYPVNQNRPRPRWKDFCFSAPSADVSASLKDKKNTEICSDEKELKKWC